MYSDKFKLLIRESSIVSYMLSTGLASMRNVYLNNGVYYQSFFSISVGLERLMKLVLHLKSPTTNPKKISHNLVHLAEKLEVEIPDGTLEKSALLFFDYFATKGRYAILDSLFHDDITATDGEPIKKFYSDFLQPILKVHPPRSIRPLTEVDDIFFALRIKEDFSVDDKYSTALDNAVSIQHAAKYGVMYIGRLLQPFIQRLISFQGNGNPYFGEHFTYLLGDDKYFLSRKTYR